MKLTSNTILITGGASGIGLRTHQTAHALGNTILITGRDQAKDGPCESGLSKNFTPFEATFPIRNDRTPLREVTKQFPESTF